MKAKHRMLQVDARQYVKGGWGGAIQKPNVELQAVEYGYVETREGRRTIYPGWWVLTYADGSHRVCDAASFEQLFYVVDKEE
jgi:hypothetical protein